MSAVVSKRKFVSSVFAVSIAIGGCNSSSTSSHSDAGGGGDAQAPLDCVGVLRATATRGTRFANVHRLGRDHAAFRETLRIGDLGPADITDLCDWEACVLTNGYGHTCFINDAGVERCRICDGGVDCANHLASRDECVNSAQLPERRECHIGLRQECLIQRGLRGYPDSRLTNTCHWADQSCTGQLPGDLSEQALYAQRETEQVTIEVFAATAKPFADGGLTPFMQKLAQWDGGLPSEISDAAADDAGR